MWKNLHKPFHVFVITVEGCGKRVEKSLSYSQSIYTYLRFPLNNVWFSTDFPEVFPRKSKVLHKGTISLIFF